MQIYPLFVCFQIPGIVPELTLEFGGGDAALRRSQQMHGREPIQQRDLTSMHDGAGRMALAIMTLLAFETFLVTLPVMVDAFALRADHALSYSVLFQLALACFLTGKLLGEINQVHLES